MHTYMSKNDALGLGRARGPGVMPPALSACRRASCSSCPRRCAPHRDTGIRTTRVAPSGQPGSQHGSQVPTMPPASSVQPCLPPAAPAWPAASHAIALVQPLGDGACTTATAMHAAGCVAMPAQAPVAPAAHLGNALPQAQCRSTCCSRQYSSTAAACTAYGAVRRPGPLVGACCGAGYGHAF